MTFTYLGAEWPDETRDLSSDAYRLHVDALCYSTRLLADLILSKRDLTRCTWITDPAHTARELVDAGWWQDCGDTYWIGLKFPEWQRSREQVQTKRKTDNKAQRRKRLHDRGDHSECLRSCSSHESSHDNADESSLSAEQNRTAALTEPTSTDGVGAQVTTLSWPEVAEVPA